MKKNFHVFKITKILRKFQEKSLKNEKILKKFAEFFKIAIVKIR